ncbi:MAG TPA: DUF4113 domain-containing protein [Candidatus Saccharimonadales bacterium]|nr:DUF4113 domain-containing protein [Candidatus Saccharimonadales bacterium]
MLSKSSAKSIFALVDCDNFFVSCERVFRPDLWNKPVVVLSNNDGCIVARSNEVKAFGIPMGVPYFKVRDLLHDYKVTLFSGNFALYGDFSQRVVGLLEAASPRVEVYSVDESFLELSSLGISDYTAWALDLRQKIWQWLGVPVSIGVAPTKTLAKAAAEHAKHTPSLGGAYSLVADATQHGAASEARRLQLLKDTPLKSVWGVGWRTAPTLSDRGLKTAYDLSLVSDAWAKQRLTIRGLNTVRELRGEPCYEVEDVHKPQQSLAVTRTFAHRVRAQHELEGLIASFTARVAGKLRKYQQITGALAVFIAGDRHRDGDNYRRVSTLVPLLQASNDTAALLQAALQGLTQLYDPDFTYRRGGVIALDLAPENAQQLSWLSSETPVRLDERKELMQAVDALNTKYHTRLVYHAVEPAASEMLQGTRRSHAYTTSWQELPRVNA